jgi:hypothetical protein
VKILLHPGVFGGLLIIVVILAGGFGIIQLSEGMELEAEVNRLRRARDQAIGNRDGLSRQQASIEREQAITEKKLKQSEAEKKELEDLTQRLTKAEARAQAAGKELMERVSAERKAAIGEQHPVLRLPKGREVTGVKIRAVGETSVQVMHNSGAMRLSRTEVPAEWAQRFLLTDPPPKPVASAEAGAAEGIHTASTGEPAPPAGVKDAAKVSEAEIQEMQNKILATSYQISLNRTAANSWNSRANDYANKTFAAKAAGRSSSYGPLQSDAQKRALSAEAEVTRLRFVEAAMRQKLSSILDARAFGP